MKRPSTKWEMIFANNISNKEFMSQIHKELKQLNTKKKNPIKKTEQRLWADIFVIKTHRLPTGIWEHAQYY